MKMDPWGGRGHAQSKCRHTRNAGVSFKAKTPPFTHDHHNENEQFKADRGRTIGDLPRAVALPGDGLAD